MIFKHSGPGQLIDAIRRVANGGTWLDDGTLRSLIADSSERKDLESTVRSLSERQRQVLRSILDGLSNKEIAAKLQVSETSLKSTIQELFNKAGVRTRSQLVRIAIEKYSTDWLRSERVNFMWRSCEPLPSGATAICSTSRVAVTSDRNGGSHNPAPTPAANNGVPMRCRMANDEPLPKAVVSTVAEERLLRFDVRLSRHKAKSLDLFWLPAKAFRPDPHFSEAPQDIVSGTPPT